MLYFASWPTGLGDEELEPGWGVFPESRQGLLRKNKNELLIRRASPLQERACAVTPDGHSGVQVDALSRRAILSVPTTGAEAMLYLTSLKALGAHNAKNAAVAALLALGLDVGVNESHLQEAVATLHPLPHRMEVGAMLLPSSPISISISISTPVSIPISIPISIFTSISISISISLSLSISTSYPSLCPVALLATGVRRVWHARSLTWLSLPVRS